MSLHSELFGYAFRPFFLLGACGAIMVMALWSLALLGHGPVATLPMPIFWHAHEMLFAFIMAVVAGFVMTAVANWTGRARLHGAPLTWLVVAWLAGRVAVISAGVLPFVVVLVADMLFPLLLVGFFGREVFAAANRRNYFVVGLVAVIALLNLLYHVGTTGVAGDLDRASLLLMIHVVLVLIATIGGRIVPAFTGNWLRAHPSSSRGAHRLPVSWPALDRATLVSTALVGVLLTFAPAAWPTAVLALVTAGLHGWRLGQWRGWSTRTEPLLFVLHVAYAWLPIGYLLSAWSVLGSNYPPAVALHALTMGAIGTMILAMITRVSLGHTGRPLHAPRLIVFAYALMTVVVLMRIAGPLTGQYYMKVIETATLGWMLAFGLFIWVYWPILTTPGAAGAPADG